MSARLDITVLSGVSSGDIFRFELEVGKEVSVGRATDCNLVLQDPTISRKHLTIEYRPNGFYLVDNNSTHGTFHMGFHLKPGPEGARRLLNNDEFKIGEILFRVSLTEEAENSKNETEKPSGEAGKPAAPRKLHLQKKHCVICLLVLLLGLLFLMPSGEQGLPAQRSNEVMLLPNYGVVGYWLGGNGEAKDQTHLDFAQFELPASDALIEYDYIGQARLEVRIDDVVVGELPPSPDEWRVQQIILRGLSLGTQGRIVFNNLDYPAPSGSKGPLKRWAIRDIRVLPLTSKFGVESGYTPHLEAAIGLVEGIDKSPEGLFLLIRGLQRAAVELLKEIKIDAISFPVDVAAENAESITDITLLKQRLGVLNSERAGSFTPSLATAQLQEIAKIIGQLDAELWRRCNNRMNRARLAAKTKDFIEAHDQLLAAKTMFPEEADYRWVLVNRMFTNNKIVPKRIREAPNNFRK